MKISVIIPCYNAGRFLAEAIESVLAQDYPDKEVIVVNDGSTDNSREVALSFVDKVRYIEQENRGVSAARNAGIRAAMGGYIAFLDADDYFLPGHLEIEAAYLDRHPDLGMVCSDYLVVEEGKGLAAPSAHTKGCSHYPENMRWETLHRFISTSSVMLRRECLDRVGLFDEDIRIGGEEWLMWLGISRLYNISYFDAPLTVYRWHECNFSHQKARLAAGQRYVLHKVVSSATFSDYPAHFRARLLFFRAAPAWRFESKATAVKFALRAIFTDPRQIGFGAWVLIQGIQNSIRGLRNKDSGSRAQY